VFVVLYNIFLLTLRNSVNTAVSDQLLIVNDIALLRMLLLKLSVICISDTVATLVLSTN